jgi:hypothetical protein
MKILEVLQNIKIINFTRDLSCPEYLKTLEY